MEFSDSDSLHSDSDELDEELESELYSVLHYNILSDEIPSNLLDKYDIKRKENEFFISLKTSQKEPIQLKDSSLSESCIPCENLNNSSEIITISDDDSDSVIILNDSVSEISVSSSSSVIDIEDSSCSSEMDDLVINIEDHSPLSYNSAIDESADKSIEVNWKDVVSPSNWTSRMKKYYNDPCKKLLNFNFGKILEELKGKHGKWDIIAADMFPVKKKAKRCTHCRQTDHLRKDCPRKHVNCHMCGNPGHSDYNCPYKKCLNCGQRSPIYIDMCQRCEEGRYQICRECKQMGHSRNHCPDAWRRFHATTKGELVKDETLNERTFCCNCGKSDHRYEDCHKIYWSIYPPTSFLVKNSAEQASKSPKGKRSWNFNANSNDFDRTPKLPRVTSTPFHQSHNQFKQSNSRFNESYSPLTQPQTSFNQTPAGTPKRSKKKRYFQNNFVNKGNVNNRFRQFWESKKKQNRKKKKNNSSLNKTV